MEYNEIEPFWGSLWNGAWNGATTKKYIFIGMSQFGKAQKQSNESLLLKMDNIILLRESWLTHIHDRFNIISCFTDG